MPSSPVLAKAPPFPYMAEPWSPAVQTNEVGTMTDIVSLPASEVSLAAVPRPLLDSNCPNVFLVGEHLTVLHHVFEQLHIRVQRTCTLVQFGRRHIPDSATAMLQALQRDKPVLLWIQWHPEARTPRSRPNIRTAVEFLSGLVELQLEQGGKVLVEGRAMDVPVRDEVFCHARRLGQLLVGAAALAYL